MMMESLKKSMLSQNSSKNNSYKYSAGFTRIPKLTMEELKSSQYILECLQKPPNVEVIHPITGTGINAVLRTGKPGPIALRADFDALP